MIIGILQADSVLPQYQGVHGDYPSMFMKLLSRADPDIRYRHYDVEAGKYPDQPGDCDGYVITGSKKSVYDDEPWIHNLGDFVRALHESGIRTVGVCFGHQLMAHVLGGNTGHAGAGWGVGVHEHNVVARDDFMDPELASINLVVSHKDQVTHIPEGAEVLASSEFCPMAMFRYGDMLGLQGHPEFGTGYSKDLMDMRRETLGERTYRDGVSSLTRNLDVDAVGRWIVNFLAGV